MPRNPSNLPESQLVMKLISELIGQESKKVRNLLQLIGPRNMSGSGAGQLQMHQDRLLRISENLFFDSARNLTNHPGSRTPRGAGQSLAQASADRFLLRKELHANIVGPVTNVKRSLEKDLGFLHQHPSMFNRVKSIRRTFTGQLGLMAQEESRRIHGLRDIAKAFRKLQRVRGGSGPLIAVAMAGMLPALLGLRNDE